MSNIIQIEQVTYMYVTIKVKQYSFEREQGGVCGRVWRKEIERDMM